MTDVDNPMNQSELDKMAVNSGKSLATVLVY